MTDIETVVQALDRVAVAIGIVAIVGSIGVGTLLAAVLVGWVG